MIIYLPRTVTGLKKMEENLTKLGLTVSQVLAKLPDQQPEVEFSLPRFKMESTFNLKPALQKVSAFLKFISRSILVTNKENRSQIFLLFQDGSESHVRLDHRGFLRRDGWKAKGKTNTIFVRVRDYSKGFCWSEWGGDGGGRRNRFKLTKFDWKA